MDTTTLSTYNSKIITPKSNMKKSSYGSFISKRVRIIMIMRRLIFDWLFFQSRRKRKAKKSSKVAIHTKLRSYSTTTDSIDPNSKLDKYQGPSSIIHKDSLDSTLVNFSYYYYQIHFNCFAYRNVNLWVPYLSWILIIMVILMKEKERKNVKNQGMY